MQVSNHQYRAESSDSESHGQGVEERKTMQQNKCNGYQAPETKIRDSIQKHSQSSRKQRNKEHQILVDCQEECQTQDGEKQENAMQLVAGIHTCCMLGSTFTQRMSRLFLNRLAFAPIAEAQQTAHQYRSNYHNGIVGLHTLHNAERLEDGTGGQATQISNQFTYQKYADGHQERFQRSRPDLSEFCPASDNIEQQNQKETAI